MNMRWVPHAGIETMSDRRTEAVSAWAYRASRSSRSAISFAEPVDVAGDRKTSLMAHFGEILLLFGLGLGFAGAITWIAMMAWILIGLALGAAGLIL
jgi:hypothetical protein